jgi:Family of unknown function (DUF6035)
MTQPISEAANKRSFPHVLDRQDGTWLDLDGYLGAGDYGEVVAHKRVGLRMALLDGTERYVCVFCEKAMMLASREIRDRTVARFYFKHVVDDGTCSGSKGLSAKAITARRFAHAKESLAHKAFKQWLLESMAADPRFTDAVPERRVVDADGVEWRQPDVQASFLGQKVVFEAQLSTTFLHVIAERMRFYHRNDSALLWLFRDIDSDAFRLSEDDIFYSNNRNAFRVTPETVACSIKEKRFALECVWHEPQAGGQEDTDRHEVVFFDQLTLDKKAGVPRAFYFDYDEAKRTLQVEQQLEQARLKDQPLHDAMQHAMESFTRWSHEERTREWAKVVAQFKRRGFTLPYRMDDPKGTFYLLQAAYSAKLGRVVGCGHGNLVGLAHTLFERHKDALWVFRIMLAHYQRADDIRKHDKKGLWVPKVKAYLHGWQTLDPAYKPNHRFDDLLAFLFPEVGSSFAQEPREVLGRYPVAGALAAQPALNT